MKKTKAKTKTATQIMSKYAICTFMICTNMINSISFAESYVEKNNSQFDYTPKPKQILEEGILSLRYFENLDKSGPDSGQIELESYIDKEIYSYLKNSGADIFGHFQIEISKKNGDIDLTNVRISLLRRFGEIAQSGFSYSADGLELYQTSRNISANTYKSRGINVGRFSPVFTYSLSSGENIVITLKGNLGGGLGGIKGVDNVFSWEYGASADVGLYKRVNLSVYHNTEAYDALKDGSYELQTQGSKATLNLSHLGKKFMYYRLSAGVERISIDRGDVLHGAEKRMMLELQLGWK